MQSVWLRKICLLTSCIAASACGTNPTAPTASTSTGNTPEKSGAAKLDVTGNAKLKIDTEAEMPLRLGLGDSAERLPGDPPSSDDSPPPQGLLGRWTFNIVAEVPMVSQLWLVEVSGTEDAYDAKVIDSALRVKAAISEFKNSDSGVGFQIMLNEQPWPFEGIAIGGRVQGSLELRGQPTLAWLERTKQKSFRGGQTTFAAPEAADFETAQQPGDPRQQAKLLIQFVEQHSDSILVFDAFRSILRLAKVAELSEQEVLSTIEKYSEMSKAWGSRWSEYAVENTGYDLATADVFPAIALDYAEQAKAALPGNANEARKKSVQLALAIALVRNDKAEEGKKLLDELVAQDSDDGELRYYSALTSEKLGDLGGAMDLLISLWPHPLASRELERIWKDKNGGLDGLDERLDGAYLKRNPPILAEPYSGRLDAASDHVVLAELFTGTSCPPCVAADVAFEALEQTFKRSDLVLLQYHLHVPGPDPLCNADTEARAEYYKIHGTPSMLVNGKEAAPGGGKRQDGPDKYGEYRAVIEKELQLKSPAKIDLRADRAGDVITIDAELRDVQDPGEKLRLRLALVEDTVRFTGLNGVRLHHAVVRAMPGGTEGVPVTTAAMTQSVKIDLAELKQSLTEALTSLEKQSSIEFPAKPLDLDHLAVVAILQDDATQAVAQSAFVSLDSPAKEQEKPAAEKQPEKKDSPKE